MSNPGTLDGVLAPVLTPFTNTLMPHLPLFVGLARHLMGQGLGLAPFGTTSEGNSLGVAEKVELLDALVGAGLDMGRVMPGTGCCALSDSVALTSHAVKRGCGGVLMLPPFYYKNPSEDGLFAAFAEVIERVGDDRLRLYLYHFPQQSQIPITHGLIERLLAAYPATVVGIKDSSGDLANMETMCRAYPGFKVFSGTERFILPVMRAGGAGCISANANIHGPAMLDLWRRWQEPEAERLQADLGVFRAIMEGMPLIAALKALTARRTGEYGWRRVRPPLVALAPEAEIQLVERLGQAGIVL
ncbi:4-hydroxy-tetrahydrodipicolinate synthase [Paramagnetospirillum magnetotacticum MS-1]|uniref:4-hydroxy-tetrahydrodipicolinate synthase n=1 Tax=Paramagnetospirillum magnetotacticum MS-1 TaxID=272627 RepID=A0A0C2YV08_PARME|nr:dihydrodipicolinate synthase family protein [Paramagnetospirillum magnetotacticum]KIL98958.1 4-hydroxy-tetrahydrodipicolinate synthase [Paramagnetospirillum magnetotacticum MS-1]